MTINYLNVLTYYPTTCTHSFCKTGLPVAFVTNVKFLKKSSDPQTSTAVLVLLCLLGPDYLITSLILKCDT